MICVSGRQTTQAIHAWLSPVIQTTSSYLILISTRDVIGAPCVHALRASCPYRNVGFATSSNVSPNNLPPKRFHMCGPTTCIFPHIVSKVVTNCYLIACGPMCILPIRHL